MNETTTPKQTTPAALSSSDLLAELDALYKEFKEVNHQAIWGGSWEREHSAQMQLKPIVNKLFDTTIKFLEARSANDALCDGSEPPQTLKPKQP